MYFLKLWQKSSLCIAWVIRLVIEILQNVIDIKKNKIKLLGMIIASTLKKKKKIYSEKYLLLHLIHLLIHLLRHFFYYIFFYSKKKSSIKSGSVLIRAIKNVLDNILV